MDLEKEKKPHYSEGIENGVQFGACNQSDRNQNGRRSERNMKINAHVLYRFNICLSSQRMELRQQIKIIIKRVYSRTRER